MIPALVVVVESEDEVVDACVAADANAHG